MKYFKICCLVLLIGGVFWFALSADETSARNDIPATQHSVSVQHSFEGALR